MIPTDDIIAPIIDELASALSVIEGLGRMYKEPPDGPPEDNSVIFPLSGFKFEGDTAGKMYVRLTFSIRYMVRRSKFTDNLKSCYKMFSSFSRVLSAWSTQSLNDTAIEVSPMSGSISQIYQAGQTLVCMTLNTEVLTEFNILTAPSL